MGAEQDLAELRTVVARAREQAHEVAREARAGRAALAEARAQVRAQREALEREARSALRHGTLGHEERALMERIDRGETTWEAVSHGTDDHWTARGLRERVGEQVEDVLQDLREDPEFRVEHDAALRAADEMAERVQW